MNDALLRFPEVRTLTGLSRATIWRLERDGRFPARRLLGVNSVGWLRSEVQGWVQSRQVVQGGTQNG